MSLLRKIFNNFPLRIRLYFREHSGLKTPVKLYQVYMNLRKKFKEFKLVQAEGLDIKDGIEIWYKSFKKFLRAQPREAEVALEFFTNTISIQKLSDLERNKKDVILLCIVKNDLLKIKNLIIHHRKIGIKHFGILDNESTDGTKEWLQMQQDVDLFNVDDKYTTNRREAWVNRLVAYYGLNRWYLILDSDELFAFYKMELKNINSLIEYCEINSIYRLRALMIDMYANDSFYSSDNDVDYLDNCRYFDLNSYNYVEKDLLDLIIGGPRGRLFDQDPWLTKYPLCYLTEGDIQGKSHFLFPYNKNKNSRCSTALLHYKFLPRDIQKYRRIATDGNYFNGSVQYKDYINHIDNAQKLSFINDKSQEYTNTDSLYEIPILDKINL